MFYTTYFTHHAIFLLFFIPFSLSFYLGDSSPLLSFNDQVRERHLYTENKRQGLFLEMASDGTVRGTPSLTAESVLELRSVRAGETVIRGVSSSLYLCVDETGHLRGQRTYSDTDCSFKEFLQADGYTLFQSLHHRLPVSLASQRFQEKHVLPFSQFVPLRNVMFLEREEKENENLKTNKEYLNLDSDDPFGMGLKGPVLSPGFNN